MTEADRLEGALREYQRVHQLMVKTTARKDDGWKHDLIALRRQLQAQLTQLAGVSEEIGPAVPDPQMLTHYRERLSQMRHKVALHQADWPVVQVDSDDPRHRASIDGIRAATQAFVAAAERVLTALRGSSTDSRR